jgi:hypothetical protein
MSDLISVNKEHIQAIPDKRAAIAMCVLLSGLPRKAVAGGLDIEPSHLDKMLTGTGDSLRHFPHEKELALMDLCRNEVPLIWLLIKRGYPSIREIIDMQLELIALRGEVVKLRAEAGPVLNVFKNIGDVGCRECQTCGMRGNHGKVTAD